MNERKRGEGANKDKLHITRVRAEKEEARDGRLYLNKLKPGMNERGLL